MGFPRIVCYFPGYPPRIFAGKMCPFFVCIDSPLLAPFAPLPVLVVPSETSRPKFPKIGIVPPLGPNSRIVPRNNISGFKPGTFWANIPKFKFLQNLKLILATLPLGIKFPSGPNIFPPINFLSQYPLPGSSRFQNSEFPNFRFVP